MIRLLFTLIITIITLNLSGCDPAESEGCPDTNCADYVSQEAAQAAFDADPDCRGDLDADNDGKACEQFSYSSGNTGCPTTAACGCSNKTQSQCGGTCCKWTVGSGCGCS
jgi:hypothetical protein